MKLQSLLFVFTGIMIIGSIIYDNAYAQAGSESPFERKFGDVKFLDAFFGTADKKIEVNPGDRNLPFTIVVANVGTQDITGIKGQLSLPFGFSPTAGSGSLIEADFDSNALAGDVFVLTFFVDISEQAEIRQYPALLKEREEAIAGVREQAKSQNELLKLEKQTENKLKEQIADLEWQLGAREGILETRGAEVSDFKKKTVSQIRSLETQLRERDETLKTKESALQQLELKYQGEINELQTQLSQKESLHNEREEAMVDAREQTQTQAGILEAHLQAEDEMKTKIVDLELQMEAEKGILAERDTEVLNFKRKAASRIQSLEAQLQERDETLQTKESALQQLEARTQSEINALMDQLSQKENLLKKRDEAMAGVKNQASSQVALLKVIKHAGEELKAIKSIILKRQWGPRLGY